MPRCGRIKEEHAIYHIMMRSISEALLFKENEDKEKFLFYIKKYMIQFNFKLYGYCLMPNHIHLIVDTNGADLSKIMHGINQSYAQYFNRKYGRHGHLFQDRFKSKIVKNEKYLMVLSLYIHKNPMAIEEYKYSLEKYEYSSLGIYLGIAPNKYEIIEKDFILGFFGHNNKEAIANYKKVLYENEILDNCSDNCDEVILNYNQVSCDIQRKISYRNKSLQDIWKILLQNFNVDENCINIKYNKKGTKIKAMFVLLARNFCNSSYREISNFTHNISEAQLSKLCSLGTQLVMDSEEYNKLFNNLCLSLT